MGKRYLLVFNYCLRSMCTCGPRQFSPKRKRLKTDESAPPFVLKSENNCEQIMKHTKGKGLINSFILKCI